MATLKVTDPKKKVTDPVLLAELQRRGFDKDYVEFTQDYGKRIKGKSSPYAKFYHDLRTGARFMVVSLLPMVTPEGEPIQSAWAYDEGQGIWYTRTNLFYASAERNSVKITCLSDQPDGIMKSEVLEFQPQVFLDEKEIKPQSVFPVWLEKDPENTKYHQNVLQWDYGICKRRLRIIEGKLLGSWVFNKKPNGRIRIIYNQSGNLKLKLGRYAVNNDEEVITKERFEESSFPLEVSDSLTFYSSSGDGGIRNSNANYIACQSAATGNELVTGGVTAYTQNALSGGIYYVARVFLPFDTSALPDDVVITAATLGIYGTGTNAENDAGHSDLMLYEGTQNEPITTADFDSFNSTLLTDDASPWEYPLSSGGYSTISLNAAGIALINKTGVTKYCIRQSGDVNAATPTSQNYAILYLCEKGAGYKPKLVVTYTEGEIKASSDSGGGVESLASRELEIGEPGNGQEQSLSTAVLQASDAGNGSETGGLLQSLFGQEAGFGSDNIKVLTSKSGSDLRLHSHQGQVGIPHKEVRL